MGFGPTGSSDYQNRIWFETACEHANNNNNTILKGAQNSHVGSGLCKTPPTCRRNELQEAPLADIPWVKHSDEAFSNCCCCLFEQRNYTPNTRVSSLQSPGCTREDRQLRASSTRHELNQEVTGCVNNARVSPKTISTNFVYRVL